MEQLLPNSHWMKERKEIGLGLGLSLGIGWGELPRK